MNYIYGDTEYVSHIPSVIYTDRKNKSIEILPLVYSKYDSKAGAFKYTYLEDYQTNYTAIIE